MRTVQIDSKLHLILLLIFLLSEDVGLKREVNEAADKLKSVIAPFVESSKVMAINISDQVLRS